MAEPERVDPSPTVALERLRSWLGRARRRRRIWPLVGRVRFGGLRRLVPISRVFGLDRGRPIDRFYIERFLAAHAADIRGTVLEIADATYTRRFGGAAVVRSEVLHATPGNPVATVVGDLTDGSLLPEAAFDCIVLTQTLQFIFDVQAAVRNVWRALKPGGVLLATMPGISQISRYDMDRWGEFWRFTSLSARRLLETVFPGNCVHVEVHGNVLAATAQLYGLAAEDLRPEELEMDDSDYELLIAVRAVRGRPVR